MRSIEPVIADADRYTDSLDLPEMTKADVEHVIDQELAYDSSYISEDRSSVDQLRADIWDCVWDRCVTGSHKKIDINNLIERIAEDVMKDVDQFWTDN